MYYSRNVDYSNFIPNKSTLLFPKCDKQCQLKLDENKIKEKEAHEHFIKLLEENYKDESLCDSADPKVWGFSSFWWLM